MTFTGRGAVPADVRRARAVAAPAIAAIGLFSFGAAGCGPIKQEVERPRVVETTRARAISRADARDAGLFVAAPGLAEVPGKPPVTPAAGRSASVVRVRADVP